MWVLRRVEEVVLRRPHLRLPHVRHQDRLPVGSVVELPQNPRRAHLLRELRQRQRRVGNLQLSEPQQPIRVLVRLHLVKQLAEHLLGITHNRHGRLYVLAQLCRVNVNVDDLGIRREGVEPAGHAVVHPHPHRDHHVALADRHVRVVGAVHPREAEVQPMRVGKPGNTEQRGNDRNLRLLGKRQQLIVGSAQNDAVPGHDDRLFSPGR